MPKIIVCQDAQDYRVVEWQGTLNIGREAENDVVLASPQVSRRHASIACRENGEYQLFDQGSTNGVWMEDQRVSGVRLSHGATFRIANYFCTFIDESAASPQILALEAPAEAAGMDQPPAAQATVLFNLPPGAAAAQAEALLAGLVSEATPLAPLVDLLRAVQPLDDEQLLCERLLAGALELAGAGRGFLALHNDKQELIYMATQAFEPRRESREINQELVRRLMDHGLPVRTGPAEEGGGRKGKAQAVLGAPLIREERAVGCLYLDRPAVGAFTALAEHQVAILALHGAVLLDNCANRQRLVRERATLKSQLTGKDETIIRSEKMLKLYEDIRTIAAVNVPVFIQGEAGSGKEHVASALHALSGRKGAYIPLNCAAIPEGIFESELFGSKKGAYHEAIDKPGKLELAEGGTLFLDEVADMALTLQPKLLRFLENGEITRLGDTRSRRLDVRVVTATNRDVAAMIRDHQFRDDLMQRLSCFTLRVPPLRERREDIEPLTRYFLSKFSAEYNWPEPRLTDGALQMLCRYTWPGNVRQLRNMLMRLAVQAQGRQIGEREVRSLSEEFGGLDEAPIEVFPSLEEVEKRHIKAALERAGGNISDAAALVGIARSTLYQKMKKYEIAG